MCLSGHAGNSVEALLKNNTIILVYGRERHRRGLFVPGFPYNLLSNVLAAVFPGLPEDV